MGYAKGEAGESLRVGFTRRLEPGFQGARITSNAGPLAYRALDDVLGPTAIAACSGPCSPTTWPLPAQPLLPSEMATGHL